MAESNNLNKECLGCKLVSTSTLIGAGIYVIFNAKSCQKDISKKLMKCIGGVAIGIGLVRFLDLYPCQHKFCQS